MSLNRDADCPSRAYDPIAEIYTGPAVPVQEDPQLRATCRDAFLSRLSGRRILEVGCGPGIDADHFQRAGYDVVATDASPAFIAIIRRRYPDLVARLMDMGRPDLPLGSFDGVYAYASFIHQPRAQARATLQGLRALLGPSGVLFLALFKSRRVREYVIDDWGGVSGNRLLFTCHEEGEIQDLLEDVGFASVTLHHHTSPVYALPRLVERGVEFYQVLATVPGESSA